MLVTILTSIIPLLSRNEHVVFTYIEVITVSIFIFDYLIRLLTARQKLNLGWKSFLIYPFTPFAIVDAVSILPSITVLNQSFKMLRLLRIFRTFRIFRAFRYSNNFRIIISVLKKESKLLCSLLMISIGYIFLLALVMFTVEIEHFDTFFDSLYWAVSSVTPLASNINPQTTAGKIISMISSIFGVAMIALPSGVITARFVADIKSNQNS